MLRNNKTQGRPGSPCNQGENECLCRQNVTLNSWGNHIGIGEKPPLRCEVAYPVKQKCYTPHESKWIKGIVLPCIPHSIVEQKDVRATYRLGFVFVTVLDGNNPGMRWCIVESYVPGSYDPELTKQSRLSNRNVKAMHCWHPHTWIVWFWIDQSQQSEQTTLFILSIAWRTWIPDTPLDTIELRGGRSVIQSILRKRRKTLCSQYIDQIISDYMSKWSTYDIYNRDTYVLD